MSPFAVQFSLYLSNIFSPEVLLLLTLFSISISFIYLNIKQIRYREILGVNCPNSIKGIVIVLLSTVIATILSQVIKFTYKIPRPYDMLVFETGYSFPSGHATVSFAVCSTIIFLLFKYFKDHRWYINYLHVTLFTLTALLISSSRIVLQVHRPIDIVFGILFGFISTFLSIKIYYKLILYADKKIYG
jgi:membrane-associated phospholipid phosphatase